MGSKYEEKYRNPSQVFKEPPRVLTLGFAKLSHKNFLYPKRNKMEN